MPRLLVAIIATFLFLVISSVWHRSLAFYARPDFTVIIVVYVGLTTASYRGALAVILIGYMADLFSGYLIGLNMFLSLAAFSVTLIATSFFSFKSITTRAIFILIVHMAQQALLLICVKVFKGVAPLEIGSAGLFVSQGMQTLIAAPIILTMLDKLEERFWQESQAFFEVE